MNNYMMLTVLALFFFVNCGEREEYSDLKERNSIEIADTIDVGMGWDSIFKRAVGTHISSDVKKIEEDEGKIAKFEVKVFKNITEVQKYRKFNFLTNIKNAANDSVADLVVRNDSSPIDKTLAHMEYAFRSQKNHKKELIFAMVNLKVYGKKAIIKPLSKDILQNKVCEFANNTEEENKNVNIVNTDSTAKIDKISKALEEKFVKCFHQRGDSYVSAITKGGLVVGSIRMESDSISSEDVDGFSVKFAIDQLIKLLSKSATILDTVNPNKKTVEQIIELSNTIKKHQESISFESQIFMKGGSDSTVFINKPESFEQFIELISKQVNQFIDPKTSKNSLVSLISTSSAYTDIQNQANMLFTKTISMYKQNIRLLSKSFNLIDAKQTDVNEVLDNIHLLRKSSLNPVATLDFEKKMISKLKFNLNDLQGQKNQITKLFNMCKDDLRHCSSERINSIYVKVNKNLSKITLPKLPETREDYNKRKIKIISSKIRYSPWSKGLSFFDFGWGKEKFCYVDLKIHNNTNNEEISLVIEKIKNIDQFKKSLTPTQACQIGLFGVNISVDNVLNVLRAQDYKAKGFASFNDYCMASKFVLNYMSRGSWWDSSIARTEINFIDIISNSGLIYRTVSGLRNNKFNQSVTFETTSNLCNAHILKQYLK